MTVIPSTSAQKEEGSVSSGTTTIDNQFVSTSAEAPVEAPHTPREATTWGWPTKEMKEAQMNDPHIGVIYKWLKENSNPTKDELEVQSPEVKMYWLGRQLLRFNDEILYMIRPKEMTEKLLLPEVYREEAFTRNHSEPLAGHRGIERTLLRMKQKFIWFKMRHDIADFISECQACNLNKGGAPKPKFPALEKPAVEPNQVWHMDFLGPLTETPRGNKVILVVVDSFTKWIEAIPLKDQTAKNTAEALKDIILRMGAPNCIITDQGSNFESDLFKQLCDLLWIHKKRTSVYRPWANGVAERVNRSLMESVRCCLKDDRRDWDLFVPMTASAMRATVNRSTGYTPNYLTFARQIDLPADLVYGTPVPAQDDKKIDEFVRNLRRDLRQAYEKARENLKQMQKTNKRKYDLKSLRIQYEVGDQIYLLDHPTDTETSKKLQPKWAGPGLIVEKITPYLFKVRLRNEWRTVHHDRLKKCKLKVPPKWLTKAAQEPLVTRDPKSGERGPFCLCRRPRGGRDMIKCQWCMEWFHDSCVNVTVSDYDLTSKYQCPNCEGDAENFNAEAWNPISQQKILAQAKKRGQHSKAEETTQNQPQEVVQPSSNENAVRNSTPAQAETPSNSLEQESVIDSALTDTIQPAESQQNDIKNRTPAQASSTKSLEQELVIDNILTEEDSSMDELTQITVHI